MNMIQLNRAREQDPAVLSAFLFSKLLATLFDLAHQNRFTAVRAPNQVIDNEMNPVLIALLF